MYTKIFQSTLPAKGATTKSFTDKPKGKDFNPRSPQRERRPKRLRYDYHRYFNPRSPQRERPPDWLERYRHHRIFQSTLPAKGATLTAHPVLFPVCISIHAPRKGSDSLSLTVTQPSSISIHAPRKGSDSDTFLSLNFTCNFNPRSPQRERQE